MQSYANFAEGTNNKCEKKFRVFFLEHIIKRKGQGADGGPSDTIFAFLTLNTPRSAHNKIFGAKFFSFERLEPICLYTACYKIFWRSAMKSDSQTSRFLLQ